MDSYDPEKEGGYVWLRLWLDGKNRERLLEIRQIVDERLGFVEFKGKLKEEGIIL